jgi:hypothetical protein
MPSSLKLFISFTFLDIFRATCRRVFHFHNSYIYYLLTITLSQFGNFSRIKIEYIYKLFHNKNFLKQTYFLNDIIFHRQLSFSKALWKPFIYESKANLQYSNKTIIHVYVPIASKNNGYNIMT